MSVVTILLHNDNQEKMIITKSIDTERTYFEVGKNLKYKKHTIGLCAFLLRLKKAGRSFLVCLSAGRILHVAV